MEAQRIAVPQAGERLTVTITDLAFGGEGVARWQDFVVFVPFVIPGEEVEVEISEVKKNFARARVLRVLKSSPDRVPPPCPVFGECGGCQYQHVAYEAQLRFKHKQAVDLFGRIGRVRADVVQPVVPCPRPYGYRNRIMVRSQWNKIRQERVLGFLRHDNRLVVDVAECRIAEPEINRQLRQVRAGPRPKSGVKVTLRILPPDWTVPPDSFFQTNFALLPRLVETVREGLRAAATRWLVDVYCGVGFFAIELSDLVEGFVGVELDRAAIRAARENARARGRVNGEFICGAAEDLLPQLLRQHPAEQTTVILDPPRKGCAPPLLETFRQVAPAQVIYVSCNPATLARDLNILCAGSVFDLVKLVPLDMFPQTAHLECVADLRRVPVPAPKP